jgi:hypothetical protein
MVDNLSPLSKSFRNKKFQAGLSIVLYGALATYINMPSYINTICVLASSTLLAYINRDIKKVFETYQAPLKDIEFRNKTLVEALNDEN